MANALASVASVHCLFTSCSVKESMSRNSETGFALWMDRQASSCSDAHRDEAREVRLPAAQGRRPAAAQRRRQAPPGRRAAVELGEEVLQVQEVVEDLRLPQTTEIKCNQI